MSAFYIVVDDPTDWPDEAPAPLDFASYLRELPRAGEKKTRILNLCAAGGYLSEGYYCSLLAEARGHRVLPSVNTLNDLRSEALTLLRAEDLLAKLPAPAAGEPHSREFVVLLGHSAEARLRPLGRRLFERFACPILRVRLDYAGAWRLGTLRYAAYAELDATERAAFHEALGRFTQSLWRRPRQRKAARWDFALLVDPAETLPPSDEGALKRIEKAARKVGLNPERLGPGDLSRIGEFDALFIRVTTAIDHYTYQFARRAEIEGLVVIDDPTSILRCCNKVFLQDAFSYNRVPTLRSRIVASASAEERAAIEAELGFPVVLKIPDGSFSRGVRKVADGAALEAELARMLADSALVLAQEYLYTEYDWRIGVLNGRPLYACRYFMARNHWQIYAHGEGRVDSGGFETLPTYEVPRAVLDAALRAARMIGDGLYGIDIKQQGARAYVIEVNDNPSLDHGVEDAFLGEELYMQIAGEFARRLERRGR